MTKILKKDFIEIEYTGSTKDGNIIFDTTDEKIAKENDLHTHHDFGPIVICVGEGQILPGIDKNLEGKELGKEYTVEIKPEDAFGNKNAKLIRLIPTSKFKQQNMQPMPGLQINVDGMVGTIKTVSGGRNLVDFNHPLAGKELQYKIKVNKMIMDDNVKLKNYINLSLGSKDFSTEIKENNATIKVKVEVPDIAKEKLSEKIKELIPNIKKVDFLIEAKQENK